jgi:hypothetical protein
MYLNNASICLFLRNSLPYIPIAEASGFTAGFGNETPFLDGSTSQT